MARLIAKGYKVAICEQMEDPSKAKGLVKRDIIRVVTPCLLYTSYRSLLGFFCKNGIFCRVPADVVQTALFTFGFAGIADSTAMHHKAVAQVTACLLYTSRCV